MKFLLAAALFAAMTGGPELDLDKIADRFDLARTSEPATGRETLRGPGLTVSFAPGLRVAVVNGEVIRLEGPVEISGGRIRLPADLASLIERLAPARKPVPEPAAKGARVLGTGRPFKVVVDAGHGGIHTGCHSRNGYTEKEVTLDVSGRLKMLLEEMGAEVIMTRDSDSHFSEDIDTDLMRRVAISDRARPDVFLSIHCNWAPNPGVRGFEVYVSRDGKADRGDSRRLAAEIRSAFRDGLDTEDRGIKEAGFKVVRHTDAPAVLVELDFISNPLSSRQFADPDHRQKVAELLADAVKRFATR
ncbi:MAG TPA: N-acetylmuramoyl-L-alanine amidase [Planctomycetota bacterium]|nr:N-acetylmuramoyl-L-alanine amidase [Planctomycetota bacterium]